MRIIGNIRKYLLFKAHAYMLPFTAIVFMLFILIITSYNIQFGLKLKTIHNLNMYYTEQLTSLYNKDDASEKRN
ncbi:hypothetical protein CNQ82_07645 [Staphylococcus debuckii]|nr:hypothetical protein CNQ82_07645 [Staphylococcus debuckii]